MLPAEQGGVAARKYEAVMREFHAQRVVFELAQNIKSAHENPHTNEYTLKLAAFVTDIIEQTGDRTLNIENLTWDKIEIDRNGEKTDEIVTPSIVFRAIDAVINDKTLTQINPIHFLVTHPSPNEAVYRASINERVELTMIIIPNQFIQGRTWDLTPESQDYIQFSLTAVVKPLPEQIPEAVTDKAVVKQKRPMPKRLETSIQLLFTTLEKDIPSPDPGVQEVRVRLLRLLMTKPVSGNPAENQV